MTWDDYKKKQLEDKLKEEQLAGVDKMRRCRRRSHCIPAWAACCPGSAHGAVGRSVVRCPWLTPVHAAGEYRAQLDADRAARMGGGVASGGVEKKKKSE
jgi:hypothetical protein